MTAFILATFVIVGLTLVALWFYFRSATGRHETTSALRELLLSRAEGKLTAEEFERRQAALYASMLDSTAPRAVAIRWYFFLVPVLVAATMAALYYSFDAQQSASSTSMAQPVASLNADGAPRSANSELQELARQIGEKLGESVKPAPAVQSAGGMPDRPGGDMGDMAKRLADRLAREPNNGSGWELLGRSYVELRRYSDANEAFAKAAKLLPPDATLLADWADAYVLAHENKWDKQAFDIVDRALSIDPKHLKALALAGRGAFSSGNFKQAAAYWTRVKSAAPAGSIESKEADMKLEEARSKLAPK
jgi:cytochrome c-type biogenesis protein CcmH